MVLTFKDYNSLLEIRFDIENELDIKIDDIRFVYSKKSSITTQTTQATQKKL